MEKTADQLELIVLRHRVKAQRAELRRLNKYLGPYWAGFRYGCDMSDAARLRGKLISAFGYEAVHKAEYS